MNCEYHKDRESVNKCKICGKEICKECDEVQSKYSACPSCVKETVGIYYDKIKRGFKYNILIMICAVAFLAMYVVELALGKLSLTYIIIGAVCVAILIPLSIFMLLYSVNNLKKHYALFELANSKLENNQIITENIGGKNPSLLKNKKCEYCGIKLKGDETRCPNCKALIRE